MGATNNLRESPNRLPTTQRAGFYWVPEQGPASVTTQRQYVANYIPEQVARTSWVPEEITRKVPVERTRYEEEVEYRRVPVKSYKMVAEEQVRYVPKKVRKPITEQYTRKVPVTTTRWEEEEVVRKIPQKTYRYEYEDRVKRIPVEVKRTVPVEQVMERERTIRRYVPQHTEKIVPKTVITKELVADEYIVGPVVTAVSPTTITPYHVGHPIVDDHTVSYGQWRVPSSRTTSKKIEAADKNPAIAAEEVVEADPIEEAIQGAEKKTKPKFDESE